MGWYAKVTYMKYNFPNYGWDLMLEDIQFFIDCMDYEDGGEHYRGSNPVR